MAITENASTTLEALKISQSEVDTKGVYENGTAGQFHEGANYNETRKLFDRLVEEVVASKFNRLLALLDSENGATLIKGAGLTSGDKAGTVKSVFETIGARLNSIDGAITGFGGEASTTDFADLLLVGYLASEYSALGYTDILAEHTLGQAIAILQKGIDKLADGTKAGGYSVASDYYYKSVTLPTDYAAGTTYYSYSDGVYATATVNSSSSGTYYVKIKTDTAVKDTNTEISNIKNGTTTVGKATADGSGNNIASTYCPKSRTVNGKPLTGNISLVYSDVGALANSASSSGTTGSLSITDAGIYMCKLSLTAAYSKTGVATDIDLIIPTNLILSHPNGWSPVFELNSTNIGVVHVSSGVVECHSVAKGSEILTIADIVNEGSELTGLTVKMRRISNDISF